MNKMKEALTAAERHRHNPTVMALVDKLAAFRKAEGVLRQPIYQSDPFVGYRMGIDGEDGFSPFLNITPDPSHHLKVASAIIRVSTTLECLICVLNTLGEDISY